MVSVEELKKHANKMIDRLSRYPGDHKVPAWRRKLKQLVLDIELAEQEERVTVIKHAQANVEGVNIKVPETRFSLKSGAPGV